MWKEALSRLAGLVFPERCPFCGGVTARDCPVCAACAAQLPFCVPHACRISLGPEGKDIVCYSVYRYEGAVRKSLQAFKFHGRRVYASGYAAEMARLLREEGAAGIHAVTAVPMSPKRRAARGYDQAELLGRGVASRLGLPYAAYLAKVRENELQHLLSKAERRENVREAFSIVPDQDPAGKKLLLVDDIVTTGATLAECAGVLYEGGAAEVLCLTAARTARAAG